MKNIMTGVFTVVGTNVLGTKNKHVAFLLRFAKKATNVRYELKAATDLIRLIHIGVATCGQ